MLDLRWVTENLETARQGLARRSAAAAAPLDSIEALAKKRKAAIAESEALAARRNGANVTMAGYAAAAKAEGKNTYQPNPALIGMEKAREELRALSQQQKELEKVAAGVDEEIRAILAGVPNVPFTTVPDGHDETGNVVVKTWGEKPTFAFSPKPHWEIGAHLKVLDFERATKMSGARFSVLVGDGAKLSRALAQLMLDVHTNEHGYVEMAPPVMVRGSALFGTGNLPKFEADLFKIESGDRKPEDVLYLIPTAEVPVTNYHAGEILEAGALPISYAAYTPCFRSEAGSHGRDVRGMIRQHQFDKVEIVRLVNPDDGEAEHERLTKHAEAILERLGLHYRRVLLCAGDMGFSSQKTYDLEVWLPSENTYREISSCSWFGDFQARRADLRYRPAPKDKPRFVHTLNGSGLAIGRTLVAILEQYQEQDGSVRVPDALQPYLRGKTRFTA